MRIRRNVTCLALGGVIWLAGCERAVITDSHVVAKADGQVLTVEQLASMLAAGTGVPLRRDIVERLATRWVEYSLYAQHVAGGDSLLDSATVAMVMWPDLHQARVDAFHERLVQERVAVDSAVVDSAYQQGDLRIIQHILIRTGGNATAAEQRSARERAARVRAQVLAGVSWDSLNARYNDDPGAKRAGGSLGALRRGKVVPEFEDVAFTLAPGAVSGVTKTVFGFHVIRRPRLADVREEFARAVRAELVARADSVYDAELTRQQQITVREGAPRRVRRAAEAPLRAMRSDDVLGTYRGGRFTVADFVRWLRVLPAQTGDRVRAANDSDLTQFVRSLIRNEVLVREARRAGVAVPVEAYGLARERYRRELGQLRGRLRLDSALAGAQGPDARRARAQQAVDLYLAHVITTLSDIVIVPPFLAADLLRSARWDVSTVAVDRVVEEASARRTAQARTTADSLSIRPAEASNGK